MEKNKLVNLKTCFLIKELNFNIISYYVYNFQTDINYNINTNDYTLNDISEIKYSNDINKFNNSLAVPLISDVINYLYDNYNIIISVMPRKDTLIKPYINNGCYLIIWKDNDIWTYDQCDSGNYYDLLNLGIEIILNKIKNGEF